VTYLIAILGLLALAALGCVVQEWHERSLREPAKSDPASAGTRPAFREPRRPVVVARRKAA
jgi:hypothetical protein